MSRRSCPKVEGSVVSRSDVRRFRPTASQRRRGSSHNHSGTASSWFPSSQRHSRLVRRSSARGSSMSPLSVRSRSRSDVNAPIASGRVESHARSESPVTDPWSIWNPGGRCGSPTALCSISLRSIWMRTEPRARDERSTPPRTSARVDEYVVEYDLCRSTTSPP